MIEGEVEPISGQRTPWRYPARRYIKSIKRLLAGVPIAQLIRCVVYQVEPMATPVPSTQNILLYFTYSTVLYSTLFYSTLLYFTLVYSTLLYSTLLYSILLYSTLLYSTIFQAEVLPYSVALKLFAETVKCFNLFVFIDNEAARHSWISASAGSDMATRMIDLGTVLESELSVSPYFCLVPMFSSRDDFEFCFKLGASRIRVSPDLIYSLVDLDV